MFSLAEITITGPFHVRNETPWMFSLFVKVRWADLEEQKDADRKRAIGFVVGQTDWERITDESGQLAQRALNRTKYF